MPIRCDKTIRFAAPLRSATNRSSVRFLVAVLLVLLPACRAAKAPDYTDEAGVRFMPPTGWVESDRPAVVSVANRPTHRQPDQPLPLFDAAHHERLLVRYDRLTAGQLAWMRLSVASVPVAETLEIYLAKRAPAADWRREGDVEALEVNDKPTVRAAWKGRWRNQDYLCETVALRRGEEVYLFTASFPAADTTAREQVRQAVAAAVVP